MKKTRIKPELLTLLTSGKFETFTAPELTRAYLQLPFCQSLEEKTAGQFILRNLRRLEKKNILERTGEKSGRSVRYQVSQNFSETNMVEGLPHFTAQCKGEKRSEGFVENLRKRHRQCKLELLTAIGEVEEYEAIIKELPQQRENIQELYNVARDLCSKTLGRVRALETLISSQGIT